MAEATALAVATPNLFQTVNPAQNSRLRTRGVGVRHSRVLQHQDGPNRRTGTAVEAGARSVRLTCVDYEDGNTKGPPNEGRYP